MVKNTLVQGASRGLGLAFVHALLARGDRVIATCRNPGRAEALERLRREGAQLEVVALDVEDEGSIERAAASVRERVDRLHLLLNVAGILHEGDVGPEKKLDQIDPGRLAKVFSVNAFGPLLVAKHFEPFLRHDEPAVLANLSARVGSIEDNRLGGWYAYRGSKAAQNMFTKSLSVELGRRCPNLVVVALHPGTVDTALSRPFSGRVPREKLFSPERAAEQLLRVVDGLTPAQTGRFYAWDGQPIPW